MPNVCKSILLADDTSIETIGCTTKENESDLEAISIWLGSHKLVLNLEKNSSDESEIIISRHDILPELR